MKPEAASGRMIGTRALIVVAAWVLMAAAWTPPTVGPQISTGAPRAHLHFGFIFLYVLIAFVPWMALAPAVLWLSRRFPAIGIHLCAPCIVGRSAAHHRLLWGRAADDSLPLAPQPVGQHDRPLDRRWRRLPDLIPCWPDSASRRPPIGRTHASSRPPARRTRAPRDRRTSALSST